MVPKNKNAGCKVYIIFFSIQSIFRIISAEVKIITSLFNTASLLWIVLQKVQLAFSIDLILQSVLWF